MISNNNQKFGFRDNILWITVLTLLLLLASDFLSLFHINLAVFSKEYAATFNMYLSFWTMWVVFVVAIVGISKNRYILDKLKHGNGGNTFNNLMIGFAAGFLMNGACALSAYLHGDIKLSFYRFEPVPVLFMFIAVFIQSSAEELVCRGFMLQRIAYRYGNSWMPTIITSCFFMILHLGNDHVSFLPLLDLFLSGILFGAMIRYFDSIWMAMGCHTAWNFTQNILLGLPNSGAVPTYSIFKLDTKHALDSFAYNTGFGLEGTIMSVIVMIVGFIVLKLIYSLHTKKIFSDK